MVLLPIWIICLRLIFLIIIFTLGVSGNGTIILVQCKNRKKSSTDCLILAMAIFDFVLAGVVAPMAALQSFTEVWSKLSSDWTCKFYQYVRFISTFASTQLLAAVAFDRYRNTCRPHAKWFNPRTAAKLSIIVTLNSMAVCCFVFFIYGASIDGSCVINDDRRFEGTMFSVSLATLFLVAMVVVTVCYSMVASTLHKRHRQKVHIKQIGPVSMSTNTSSVPLFKKRNKVGVVDATSSTNIDTLTRQRPGDKQGLGLEPGPSNMKDETEPTMTTQKPTKTSSDEVRRTAIQFLGLKSEDHTTSAIHDTKSMNIKQELPLDSCTFANIGQTHNPCLSLQLFERSTCGPTGRRSVEGRPEGTSSDMNDDRRPTPARKLTTEERKINKTTKMMFLITAIYIVTWIVVWTTKAYAGSIGKNSDSELRMVLFKLISLAYMINSVSNPILYILMSSLFRKRVRAMFSKNAQSMTL